MGKTTSNRKSNTKKYLLRLVRAIIRFMNEKSMTITLLTLRHWSCYWKRKHFRIMCGSVLVAKAI